MNTHLQSPAKNLEELLDDLRRWSDQLPVAQPDQPSRVTLQVLKPLVNRGFTLKGNFQKVSSKLMIWSVDAYQENDQWARVKVVRLRYYYNQAQPTR
jgi:hypothetical protein